MNFTPKPFLSCPLSTLFMVSSLKKLNLSMITFSILPSPSFQPEKLTPLLVFLMTPCPTPLLVKPFPRPWRSLLLPSFNWWQTMSTLMPHLMTLEDLAPLKFSPLTTLLTHWMHLPSTLLCLVLLMSSSTSFTINFLHTFHLFKTKRCRRTSFSPLLLVLLTRLMLGVVFILTSLGVTSLRHRTIILSFTYQ